MAPVLRDNPVFSGNTILGDGSVVMILDPNGIASKRGQPKGADRSDAGMAGLHAAGDSDQLALLLLRGGSAAPQAVRADLGALLEAMGVHERGTSARLTERKELAR